jgi:chorismate-pyruvate lyase
MAIKLRSKSINKVKQQQVEIWHDKKMSCNKSVEKRSRQQMLCQQFDEKQGHITPACPMWLKELYIKGRDRLWVCARVGACVLSYIYARKWR